jgi:hypothetical protein
MMKYPIGIAALVLSFSASLCHAYSLQDQVGLKEFLGSDPVTDFGLTISTGKQSSTLSAAPWAGYYWPEGFGSVVSPYRNDNFPHALITLLGAEAGFRNTIHWMKNHWGDTLSPAIGSMSDDELNKLSPSLKYDLLFSDSDFTLSHTIMSRLIQKADQTHIKSWEGICNGWSLAALSLDRPLHEIQVKSASGRMITFYPHDIMALSALLYARSPVNDWSYYTRDSQYQRTPLANGADINAPGVGFEPVWLRFVGRRCDGGGATGCNDLNPGVFHTAVVNSIGFNNSGFVMDKHKGPAIGNVAVFGYSMKLYNANTNAVDDFDKVITHNNLSDEQKAEGGVSKVGVVMTLTARKELSPWDVNADDETHYWDLEKTNEYTYNYVLILDANNNVIDGEWRMRLPIFGAIESPFPRYPDFLWKLPTQMHAFSGAEGSISSADFSAVNGQNDAFKAAADASSKLEQPLGSVIYPMLDASRTQ